MLVLHTAHNFRFIVEFSGEDNSGEIIAIRQIKKEGKGMEGQPRNNDILSKQK